LDRRRHGVPFRNTTGTSNTNTATGAAALGSNTTGGFNTATGVSAISSNTTGSDNTAIGSRAGQNVLTGSNNIHIGNQGNAADTALIRIGGALQTAPALQTPTNRGPDLPLDVQEVLAAVAVLAPRKCMPP
jgi:hypothetical protein